MMQMSFAAQELYCMAYLQKKQKMYGIPNVMHSNHDRKMQETIDSLLEQQLVTMDLDGNVFLNKDYHDLVDCYCDCQKCLTVNLQVEEQAAQNLILWQHNGQYRMAEVIGERYVFSSADEMTIRAVINQATCKATCCSELPEAVIPQIQLAKAKRLCSEEKKQDAVRLLRQNGAAEEMAWVIADGLQEKAWYLRLLCMDVQQDDCKKTKAAYLASRGILLELGETVVNLRSCATFTACQLPDMKQRITRLTECFLEKGAAI